MLKFLSGGLVYIHKLKLYELDAVEYDDPGPFTYEYVNSKTGKVTPRVYDISEWPEPPKPPKTPKHLCEPNSLEAELWHVYETYMAALNQRVKQAEATEAYCHDVAKYVIDSCLSFPFWLRWAYWLLRKLHIFFVEKPQDCVITSEDYNIVYGYALIPEVEMGDIERVLRSRFPSFFERARAFSGDGYSTKEQGQDDSHATVGSAGKATVAA